MKSTLLLAQCIVIIAVGIISAVADDAMAADRDYSGYQIAIASPQGVLQTSTGPVGFSKAQSDTFFLYGGPGTVQGRFRKTLVFPGGSPDAQGWIGVDLTEFTFNGRDAAGAQVASGVYMYKVSRFGQDFVAKMALLK